jgi:hypothetical protein
MMLQLLIYCYANGIFSSRKIERATYQNISARYITADTHPDHDTVAAFRRDNAALIHECFVQVLRLARQIGLLKVGILAIDGTKLAAATSKKSTFRYSQVKEQLAQLNAQVQSLLEKAQAADQENPDSELPEELASAQKRRARLEAARKAIEEQTQEASRQREQLRKDSCGKIGNIPPRISPTPKDSTPVNLTDPQSALKRTSAGFIQGYNAQLAVATTGGLIVAADVVSDAGDGHQLKPMVAKAEQNGCRAEMALVDTGYENVRQMMELEERGIKTLCPPQRSANAREDLINKDRRRRMSKEFRRQMSRRLQTPEGKRLYDLRKTTVEPAIGIIKSAMGFRSFRLRGLAKTRLEWMLVALAFNCRRLAR